MSSYTVTHDDSLDIAVTAARLKYNALLPPTVAGPPDAQGNPTQIANPALLAADADYVQMIHAAAARSWYDRLSDVFRIPTGDWLQRWTAAERKTARAIGAGLVPGVPAAIAQQVQGWLDQLDASPLVNLGDAVVVQGVPQVCALLEAAGAIAAGQASARAAAIAALNI